MEVEVKYPLKNPEHVIKKLNVLAIPKKKEEYQKDIYFKLGSKQLRIRESKTGNFLSYKKRIDKLSCNNYCTEIRNLKPTIQILKNIGFKKSNVIEKVRSTWEYKSFEIAIDNVKGVGHFIEVESNRKKDFSTILKLIEADVGKQDFKGYSKLLGEKHP